MADRKKRRKKRKKLHKKLVKEYRMWFWCTDICMILVILFNFGAVCITNMLVEKKDVVLMEVNPVAAEVNDYELHPRSYEIIKSVVKQAMIWFVMILVYLWMRMYVYKEWHLVLMGAVIGYYIRLTGWDFFNNLGWLINRVVC